MAKKSLGKSGGGGYVPTTAPDPYAPSDPELIMVARSDLGMRARREGLASVAGADMSDLASVLSSAGAVCHPLFGDSEERVLEDMASMPAAEGPESALPDLSLYYRVEAPAEQLEALCNKLRKASGVDAAYVKPPAYPSAEAAAELEAPFVEEEAINEMEPAEAEAPPATPDFTSR